MAQSASNASIQQPPPMSDLGNMADNWRDWKNAFDWFIIASGREKASDREKCALFLHVIGKCGRDIYEELDFKAEEKDDFSALCDKFEQRCNPQKNINYERHMFFESSQGDEQFDKYLATLKVKSKSCEFGVLRDSLILTQMIRGIKDGQLRERMLIKRDLKLQEAESWCRAAEAAGRQAAAVGAGAGGGTAGASADIEPVRASRTRRARAAPPARPSGESAPAGGGTAQERQQRRRCSNCDYVHEYGKCPAYSVQCFKCDKRGHFARCCRAGNFVRELNRSEEESDREELVINGIEVNSMDIKSWCETVRVNDVPIQFKLDSGADACVMSINSYIKAGFDKKLLKRAEIILREVSKQELPVVGYFIAELEFKGLFTKQKVYVLDVCCSNLLSREACVNLNLIMRLSEISNNTSDNNSSILKSYKFVFEGIGRLPGEHKLIVDETIPPVVRSARKIPIKLRPRLQEELQRLQELDIIAPVNEPTEWVSNIVLVEKPDGKLRLCLDPQHLNKAIKRSHFQLPTLDEITANLSDSKYFSVLDASKGFYMVVLDQASSRLCTFATPFGRFCFLRLPFGICSASEVFHNMMYKIFAKEGVEVYIDDILVHGRTRAEHDQRLREVLERAAHNGVRFNRSKCIFSAPKVKFLGHVFDKEGIRPDSDRVQAIKKIPAPQNKKELERFLGMSNYVSRFIPSYAQVVEPLRELLKGNVTFEWHEGHDAVFRSVKEYIAKAPTLKYYDPNAPVTVSVDASARGLGACLLQGGRPVAFAARTLTPTEARWAQIEKEMLAIVFGCSKFHQFIYGHREVLVETDHKPLEAIFKKPLNDVPTRLQRLLLRLQRYSLNICYVPGRYMYVADTLSRTTTGEAGEDDCRVQKKVSLHVNLLINNTNFSGDKLKLVKEETQKDSNLSAVIEYYYSGWPHTKSLVSGQAKPYWEVRDELHVVDGVVFRNDKVVIPASLRSDMLTRIHEGHLGIDKCKRRARDVMWWAGMGADIERVVRGCDTCTERRAAQPREPLAPHGQPERPWEVLATDIFQIKNTYYLLVVDYYSKYVEVTTLSNLKSSTVVSQMKSIFARHGIPKKLVSDNGLQFVSEEFKSFAAEWEFQQVTSSPHYPRSNGLAERNVQTVKNLILKAQKDNTDPYLALLNFRNAPISGERYSPAQLLMGRRLNTRLPVKNELLDPQIAPKLEVKASRDIKQKKSKEHYDRSTRSLKPLHEGEQVRIREPGARGELWARARWVPARVDAPAAQPRSYWVRTPDGGRYRRNRQQILKTIGPKSNNNNNCKNYKYDNLGDCDDTDMGSAGQAQLSPSLYRHTRSGQRY